MGRARLRSPIFQAAAYNRATKLPADASVFKNPHWSPRSLPDVERSLGSAETIHTMLGGRQRGRQIKQRHSCILRTMCSRILLPTVVAIEYGLGAATAQRRLWGPGRRPQRSAGGRGRAWGSHCAPRPECLQNKCPLAASFFVPLLYFSTPYFPVGASSADSVARKEQCINVPRAATLSLRDAMRVDQ